MLLVIVLGMTSLLFQMRDHKFVILNLYFLPVVLSGYYLGRSSACLLALFSAVSVAITITFDFTGLTASSSPVMAGLVVTVWAAALGMSALLIGTLCDERATKVRELHIAYVGVIEVLARYLQGANPRIKARSIRVAELSQTVGRALRMSQKQLDDIRVGALLFDIGNVEITTKLISRAVDTIEAAESEGFHTFQGTDLVSSLEPVLAGAVPLLLNQDDAVHDCIALEGEDSGASIPVGAKVIRLVREYDALTAGHPPMPPAKAIECLKATKSSDYSSELFHALEEVTIHGAVEAPEQEYAAV
jgi:hypothetical protein